jgi:superfamily II DNA or RNA helicase
VYAIITDLRSLVGRVQSGEISVERLVVVEESPDYPDTLLFQPALDPQDFFNRYHSWLSHYMVLNELFNLPSLVDRLTEDGWEVVFGPSCEKILANMMRWWSPLEIEGYQLHPFQQFNLRRALEEDAWFWNWSTGSGKSFCCAAGARYLFDAGEIDLVIAATVSKSKIDLLHFFEKAGLDVVINDGAKAKRRKVYAENHQVYVMNYEKLNFDFQELCDLVDSGRLAPRRVLFIFDECHRIVCSGINNSLPNKARQSYGRLRHLCRPRVWPMSASVVNGNPLRFRDVFSLDTHPNPLGTPVSFTQRYADEVKTIDIEQPSGRSFELTVIDWDIPRLAEIRHRVENHTMAVRKTDPGVAPYFKGMQTIMEPVQFSPPERHIAEYIIDRAWELWTERRGRAVNLGPFYSLLRYLCNTPAALRVTEHEVGMQIRGEIGHLIAAANSTKLVHLNEMLESIQQEGDKVAVFTKYTNLTLHLIKDFIEVPHVVHWGVGQNDRESQRVKDEFMSDPEITCFLTSDAGSHGLNLQCARYVIQYEPTYSYDDGMQRASRIDRADSHLDGLTNYVMVTEDSVEERVWNIQQERRVISAATQGTEEALSYGTNRDRALRSENANLEWLIFGDRML